MKGVAVGVWEGLTGKVTLERSKAAVWEKCTPGIENWICDIPEAGTCWAGSSSTQQVLGESKWGEREIFFFF